MENNIFPLDGDWLLYYGFPADEPIRFAEVKTLGYQKITAIIPGSVELDLMRAGVLKDIYQGTAIQDVWKLEEYDWWYVKEFSLSNELSTKTWRLNCDGIDTIADIWINGQRIDTVDNMLIAHQWLLGLLARENQLMIHIKSPLRAAQPFEYPPLLDANASHQEALWIRKAPHMYGWDIAPRLLSAGIWKSVYLSETPINEIESVYWWVKEVRGNQATVHLLHYEVTKALPSMGLSLHITLHDETNHEVNAHEVILLEFKSGIWIQTFDNIELWWPRGYGTAQTYRLEAQLQQGDNVLDVKNYTVGFRTIQITGISDGMNTPNLSMTLYINDTRISSSISYRVTDMDSGICLTQGDALSGANGVQEVDHISASITGQRFLKLEWKWQNQWYGNHYCDCMGKMNLNWYLKHLKALSQLPPTIPLGQIWKSELDIRMK